MELKVLTRVYGDGSSQLVYINPDHIVEVRAHDARFDHSLITFLNTSGVCFAHSIFDIVKYLRDEIDFKTLHKLKDGEDL